MTEIKLKQKNANYSIKNYTFAYLVSENRMSSMSNCFAHIVTIIKYI